MDKKDWLKLIGLYLIFDGAISMFMFDAQPNLYQLPRIIRIVVGYYLFSIS